MRNFHAGNNTPGSSEPGSLGIVSAGCRIVGQPNDGLRGTNPFSLRPGRTSKIWPIATTLATRGFQDAASTRPTPREPPLTMRPSRTGWKRMSQGKRSTTRRRASSRARPGPASAGSTSRRRRIRCATSCRGCEPRRRRVVWKRSSGWPGSARRSRRNASQLSDCGWPTALVASRAWSAHETSGTTSARVSTTSRTAVVCDRGDVSASSLVTDETAAESLLVGSTLPVRVRSLALDDAREKCGLFLAEFARK